jgi:hypothetical protein
LPDRRQHRGEHPEDKSIFAPTKIDDLRSATSDLCWLLTREYSANASLKIVGDRYSLTSRQRHAIQRASCSDTSKRLRNSKLVSQDKLKASRVIVDGFNLIITIEAAISGGPVILSQDGCLRDLSSVHGNYRKVVETRESLFRIEKLLGELKVGEVKWLFDRPVSNSGRLAQMLREVSSDKKLDWEIDVIDNPDSVLKVSDDIVVSSDSAVLDRCKRWANLGHMVVTGYVPEAWIIDLSASEELCSRGKDV